MRTVLLGTADGRSAAGKRKQKRINPRCVQKPASAASSSAQRLFADQIMAVKIW
jgi:hypothetical protein